MCLPYRVMEHEEWSEPNWLNRFAQITRDHCRLERIAQWQEEDREQARRERIDFEREQQERRDFES